MSTKKYRFLMEVEEEKINSLARWARQNGVDFEPQDSIFYLARDNWEIEVFTACDLDDLNRLANEYLEETEGETRRLKDNCCSMTLHERETLLRFYQLEVGFRHGATMSVNDIDPGVLQILQDKAPGVFQ